MELLNETLFMQTRLFSLFCERTNIDPKKADLLFKNYGIWSYIENCYDSLHLEGDENIYLDIINILHSKKVNI